MKKSTEMYKKLENLKKDIEGLKAEGKIEEAYDKLSELENLKKEIKVQEALEEDEANNFNGKPLVASEINETIIFNKAVLGKGLSETENALVEKVEEDGGYLVPKEQKTQIEEFKRQLIPLKDYCNVIPVKTMSGSMPLEVEADDELVNFNEVTEINQGTIKFGQTKWELSDYGDIIPISNSLLQDEKANLTNYVGKRFSKKAVRTENKKILDLLATATKKTGEDYKIIKSVINKELDPAIAEQAIIITNQDGFDYLDSLEDKNGKPLLKDSLSEGSPKLFKGKPVIVLSNQSLTTESNKLPFYVGDIASFCAFFDREAYEMAVSKEAGFTKNTTYMRVIERFDVKKVDTKAVIYIEITVAA